jgi:hypothetical protein
LINISHATIIGLVVRRLVAIFLCSPVFLSSTSGMVLHVDECGHLTWSLPQLCHALLHAELEDDALHDLVIDPDHQHLHKLLGAKKDLAVSRKGDGPVATEVVSPDGAGPDPAAIVYSSADVSDRWLLAGAISDAGPPLPDSATRASLRATILLV